MHDSGFERAHVADVAAAVGVPFAPLTAETTATARGGPRPGPRTGQPARRLGDRPRPRGAVHRVAVALADDPGVGAVALAVDLVPEYDGDDSYRDRPARGGPKTSKPVAVLASIPAAIDPDAAARLRAAGIPVLESTRTGLLALRHLLARAALLAPELPAPPPPRPRRR